MAVQERVDLGLRQDVLLGCSLAPRLADPSPHDRDELLLCPNPILRRPL
jgi:hypothetical protein